jgi:4-amino-4-deoxy-L-arabinose transferase-like glycosyltransferase
MNKIIPVSVLLIILFTVFFLHLGRLPVRLWDESRYAHNAYEMAENGNLIVPYFEGEPETWNMKPPFPIWCEALFIKLLGPTETAIRLPSAIFGLLTSLLLFFFCWKYYDNFWLGFIAALIVSMTPGYIDDHGARTGDTDIIHVFFLVLYTLYFWLYFERGLSRYLYTAMVGLTLAVLTKGIAGFFTMPVVFVAAIHFKVIKVTLKDKRFWISFSIFLLFTAGYYLLREAYTPGYMQKVIDYEITGRYMTPLEGHEEETWFYFNRIRDTCMSYWFIFIPCGVACALFSNDLRTKSLLTYITSCLLFLFVLLTFAQTKVYWYSYMLVPFCGLLAAYFIWIIFNFISQLDVKKILRVNVLGAVFLIIVFISPYKQILSHTYLVEEYSWDVPIYSLSYYLRDVSKNKIQIQSPLKVVFSGKRMQTHISFYILQLQKKNIPVTISEAKQVMKGDDVVCSLNEDVQYLQEHFVVSNIRSDRNLTFLHVDDIRNSEAVMK